VRLDNAGFRGRVAALWLLAVFLVIKAIMGVNGAINTRAVATGAAALWRWRAMVPFLYLVLLAEQIVRRLAAQTSTVARTEAGAVGMWINIAILVLLFAGLVLSLWSRPNASPPSAAP
jgi:hypothetical protein